MYDIRCHIEIGNSPIFFKILISVDCTRVSTGYFDWLYVFETIKIKRIYFIVKINAELHKLKLVL